MGDRTPLAVLVSGRGSNMEALLDAAETSSYPAEFVVVIADRESAPALERAARRGVATEVVPWSAHGDRDVFTKALCEVALIHGATGLVLAGFMRVLAPVALAIFPMRIINVHPALLPAFPGTKAVERALEHGVKITGVTVHLVDEEVDHGPIIAQEAVTVAEGDTPESLNRRLQEVEHRLLPAAVATFARGELRVDGRIVARRTR